MRKYQTMIMAAAVVASVSTMPVVAHADDGADRPANLQPRARFAEDLYLLQDVARQSLRAPVTALRDRILLPYGLSYHRDSKSLLMQPDEKSDWGIGINLNLNASSLPELATKAGMIGMARTWALELAPSGINLVPKRTPGLTFQKKF